MYLLIRRTMSGTVGGANSHLPGPVQASVWRQVVDRRNLQPISDQYAALGPQSRLTILTFNATS